MRTFLRGIVIAALTTAFGCSVIADFSGLTGADDGGASSTDAGSGVMKDGASSDDAAAVVLFSDNFQRATDPGPIAPWQAIVGAWTVAEDNIHATMLVSEPTGSVALATTGSGWTDYAIDATIAIPSGCYGVGIGGRVNAATGAHYAAWIYPEGSPSPTGAVAMSLVKLSDWTNWSGVPMKHTALTSVGTGAHHVRITFHGANITVTLDGATMLQVTDNGDFTPPAPDTSGGVTIETWADSAAHSASVSSFLVTAL